MDTDKFIAMWIGLVIMFIIGSITFYNVYTNKMFFDYGYEEVLVPLGNTKVWQKVK